MVTTRGRPQGHLTPAKSTPRKGEWAHSPSNLSIIWLLISLPLVMWDTGYVMLRPHSMPGGSLHWPLWVPYELYCEMDYIYGWKAFNEHNGFTAAQTMLNIIETAMYIYYLYIVYAYGRPSTSHQRGASKPSTAAVLGQQRYVDGKKGALAVLIVHSAAVMTVSKTVLYWLNEYFSGFANIGHNDTPRLLLWAVSNGAWIIVPSYIIYLTGNDILRGLTVAAGGATSSSDDTSLVKTE